MPVVAAEPVIVFAGLFAGITCLISNTVVVLAPIAKEEAMATVSKLRVKVEDEAVVFVATIFVTTATVVVFGAVYNVVFVVEADPRKNTLEVTGICRCTFR